TSDGLFRVHVGGSQRRYLERSCAHLYGTGRLHLVHLRAGTNILKRLVGLDFLDMCRKSPALLESRAELPVGDIRATLRSRGTDSTRGGCHCASRVREPARTRESRLVPTRFPHQL